MTRLKLSGAEVLVGVVWLFQLQNYALAIDIECIPIKLCPMALKLIEKNAYAPEVVAFLRYSHCGFAGNEPKIWCSRFKECVTPDSRNGICSDIKSCDSYVELMRNVDTTDPVVKKYLREFRCTTEFDAKIQICCTEQKTNKPPFGIIEDRRTAETVPNKLPRPQDQNCGRHPNDDKVIGGMETYLDEYPWMALLQYVKGGVKQYGCGGTVIDDRYILTAAHCVDPDILKSKGLEKLYRVILGEYDIKNETDCIYHPYGTDCADPPQRFKIENIIVHPDFEPTLMINDIALIRLNRKIIYSDYIQPICLPQGPIELKTNDTFTICGWGKTQTAKRSSVKLKGRLKYSEREVCDRLSPRNLTQGQICVGKGEGVDSCYGDSGGPLMLDRREGGELVTTLVGIVSYGIGQLCGAFPGVYTYVPPYLDWINENI